MATLLSVVLTVIYAGLVSLVTVAILAHDIEFNITRIHEGCHFAATYDVTGRLVVGDTVLCFGRNE